MFIHPKPKAEEGQEGQEGQKKSVVCKLEASGQIGQAAFDAIS
jgi:hypothetical protein